VLGRAVKLDGESYTVVGVLPPGFGFLKSATLLPLRRMGASATRINTQVIARIKPELNGSKHKPRWPLCSRVTTAGT